MSSIQTTEPTDLPPQPTISTTNMDTINTSTTPSTQGETKTMTCDCCYATSNTCKKLCTTSECSMLCNSCMETYLSTTLESFAICKNLKCPGVCDENIPLTVWKDNMFSDTITKALKRYEDMLIARLSIRCPGCHNNKAFAGHVNNNVISLNKNVSKTTRIHDARYERRLLALGVQPDPVEKVDVAMKKLIDQHDLSAAVDVIDTIFKARGETKEPTGNLLDSIIQDSTFNKLPLEKFSAIFNAFVTRFPLIKTGCCKQKVCFRCQTKGHHEKSGGSCITFNNVTNVNSNSIFPCPRCKVTLLKSEGCNAVKCPSCNLSFEWGTKKILVSSADFYRGADIAAADEGTIRGGYLRRNGRWIAIPSSSQSI